MDGLLAIVIDPCYTSKAGKTYTLEAYAEVLKKKVRLVIWRMPGGKCKLFFSTKLSMTGEEVLKT